MSFWCLYFLGLLWKTVSPASLCVAFDPSCLSRSLSLFLSRIVSPCMGHLGSGSGIKAWRLGVANSRFSELSTVSVSLEDLERTSNCAGSLLHFLISGSGSSQR